MEWKESANRIWAEDESGKVLAEIDFPESGRKAELTCSYAIRWFSRHREFEGALANPEAEYAKAENLAGPACGISRPSK